METNNETLIGKKLELEIKALQKSWWTQNILSFLKILVPVIITIITLITVWMSGFFDKQKEKLNHDISNLEIIRDSLTNEIIQLNDSVKILKIERFEIELNSKYAPFKGVDHLYNRWFLTNESKIKFYNSISKQINFKDFLAEIGITLKINDSLTYKNMQSNMRRELYEKYIKDEKYFYYGEDKVCRCVYQFNDEELMTEEKGIKYFEEGYKAMREFFLKNIQ